MITLQLDEIALPKLAHLAVLDLRRTAGFIRAFTRTGSSNGASRAAVVRIAHLESADYKPLLKLVVAKYGAEIFRRHRFKTEAAIRSRRPEAGSRPDLRPLAADFCPTQEAA